MQEAISYIDQILIYLIFGLATNLILGYAGVLQAAPAAFGAFGGYSVVYLTSTHHLPWIVAVLIGIGLALMAQLRHWLARAASGRIVGPAANAGRGPGHRLATVGLDHVRRRQRLAADDLALPLRLPIRRTDAGAATGHRGGGDHPGDLLANR